MNPASPLAPDATIAVIGAGRLGTVLARALSAAEFDVRGPFGRGDEVPESDIALLCVPDASIPGAAAAVRPHARLIGHVSGATGLEDVDFGIHPLQTFTGAEPPAVFHGIGAAIAGRTTDVRDLAGDLARALGAHPFEIDDADRAAYHAAASFASNFVLTVLDAAERLALAAGVSSAEARALLAPLARRTVDNWTATGAAEALTGPIVRGDEVTVARQREAASDLDLQELFDALAAATRSIVRKADA
ncbi:DUF2520 domain-containing protein [Microbacterium aurantiacum]|uniref:DUF2520 domain-containing protein n=1 Tax=Microbacterium aurantiacum TaxID=162393 RepID=UPI000C7FAEB3|nr:DUF2520 domain-containing protein [Microbacterium aurantiacum]